MIRPRIRRLAVRAARCFTVLVARRHRPLSPCLVLAPHADDETLGCGGTIAAMRAAGLAVTVAIATDGVGSDRLGREADVVARVRRAEALDAARALGLAEPDIIFMNLPDGGLANRLGDLTGAVQKLIDDIEPAQILVCSPIDRHPDHVALRRACAGADHRQAVVLEYLVWAWPGWPVSALTASRAQGVSARGLTLEFFTLLCRLRRSNVARQHHAKRSAIASYRSQIGDGTAARGLPATMLRQFEGRYELLVEATPARTAVRHTGTHLDPTPVSPACSQRLRTWVRTRHPRLRGALLTPRRYRNNRRWKRRHLEISVADRSLLEQVILPSIRDEVGDADVLFVGVEWYTAAYPAMFPHGNLVTLDYNPELAKYGGRRHFALDVREMSATFAAGSFAAVICNGVLGHGINESADVERTLAAFRRCLRPNGLLVIGWNDLTPFAIPGLGTAAGRAGFVPAIGAGLISQRTEPLGELRHVYEVFRADATGRAAG